MSEGKAEKRCPKCEITKPVIAFSKSSRKSDGLCVWCKECSSEQQKRWRDASPEAEKAKAAKYYSENRSAIRAKQNERRNANRDAINAQARNKYIENPKQYHAKAKAFATKNPELAKEYARRWRAKNKHIVNFKAAKRRAALRMATPVWADDLKIKALFLEAEKRRASTGTPHDVDHIVPLNSPMVQSLNGNTISKIDFIGPLIPVVQGLHCEANLRVTTEKENRLKSNTKWPNMPNINL